MTTVQVARGLLRLKAKQTDGLRKYLSSVKNRADRVNYAASYIEENPGFRTLANNAGLDANSLVTMLDNG